MRKLFKFKNNIINQSNFKDTSNGLKWLIYYHRLNGITYPGITYNYSSKSSIFIVIFLILYPLLLLIYDASISYYNTNFGLKNLLSFIDNSYGKALIFEIVYRISFWSYFIEGTIIYFVMLIKGHKIVKCLKSKVINGILIKDKKICIIIICIHAIIISNNIIFWSINTRFITYLMIQL